MWNKLRKWFQKEWSIAALKADDQPEFKHWSKIPRIENTVCTITEKLDGTNGVIVVQDHQLIAVGSRNRWLSAQHDNQASKEEPGFYTWCHEPARKEWLEKLSDGYYYGEFVGKGLGRAYGLNERRFYLFRWDLKEFENPEVGIYTIPFLGKVTLDQLQVTILTLSEQFTLFGSSINSLFRDVEGLVIQLADHRYKVVWRK